MAALGGCGLIGDIEKAGARAELERQQASVIEAAGGDCAAMRRGLDAWYGQHRAEVDASDAWWRELDEDRQETLMEDRPEHLAAMEVLVVGTITCGDVPWFGER